VDRLYENYTSEHAGLEDSASLSRVLERDLLRYLQDHQALCLDLGCGQGGLSAVLRSRGYPNSFGVDISPEQVAVAHSLGRDYVTQGSVVDYLADASSWDVVTAFDFFEHLEHSEVLPTLEAVRGALNPSGLLVARVPNAAGPLFGRYQYGDFTHRAAYTQRSLQQLANAAGFAHSEFREVRPIVQGAKSAGRRAIWSAFAGATKLALAAESGQLRGHLVTSNLMAYIHA
jgi:predicted TPR repeat methyltransferase